jgi:MraZ protein
VEDDAADGAALGGREEASVFIGTFSPRLDDKGRLILPSKFRDDLADGLVLTRGPERCLRLFTLAEFERYAEQMKAAPLAQRRIVFSGASEEQPDKQGRVTIPPLLRKYAGLTRECAVIGNITNIEIWDAQSWERYQAAQEEQFANLDQEEVPA